MSRKESLLKYSKTEKFRATQERYRATDKFHKTWKKQKARARKYPAPTRPAPAECECCGGPPNGNKTLCLDHDHMTGEFRGWICFSCNVGIGALGDSRQGLKCAMNYLNKAELT